MSIPANVKIYSSPIISILKLAVIFISLNILFTAGCTKKNLIDEESKTLDVLSRSYNNENWETRRKIINIICPYNIPQSEDLLIKALDDDHSTVRIEALKCIGEKKHIKAKRYVKKIAESEKDNNIRSYAIHALGQYRDPTAAPVFAKGLSSDDWIVREESIKGLLLINDIVIQRISVPYILKALNDERINVRISTLENLSIKDDSLYTVLSAIVNNNENYYKIELLTAALKAINGYSLDIKTHQKIITYLTHPFTEVRILSLEILKNEKKLNQPN